MRSKEGLSHREKKSHSEQKPFPLKRRIDRSAPFYLHRKGVKFEGNSVKSEDKPAETSLHRRALHFSKERNYVPGEAW